MRTPSILGAFALAIASGILCLFLVGSGGAPAALAHQADCSTLDPVVTYNAGTDECELKVAITKNGTFPVGHTLHIFPAGKITTNTAAGLTLNITGGFIVDTPSGATGTNGINGDAVNALARPITINTTGSILLHGNGTKGARITSSRTGSGNVGGGGNITILAGARDAHGACTDPLTATLTTENGSQIQANTQAGAAGAIVLNACHDTTIGGLVESASQQTGSGNMRGGGPIDVITPCSLTVTDTGKISSRSVDPRGDRVHLEGCDVVINGLVESIARAHYQPEGADGCKGATRPDKPNGTSTPTYPYTGVYSTNCVEIWGKTITVDASGAHNGQISADSGGGGNGGTGWIDLYASGDIYIIGCSTTVANDCTGATQGIGPDYFALHANGQGGSGGAGEQGGLVTVKSTTGAVNASGLAFEAYAGNQGSNSDGGTINVEANGNVDLKDSFSDDGAADQRGGIAVRSYTGKVLSVAAAFLDTCGVTVGKETGSQDNTCTPAVPTSPRWVSLQGCGTVAPNDGVAYLGTTDQNPPNKPADSCVAGPVPPSYVVVRSDCARCHATAAISGVKFEDLTANGLKDSGDPLLAGWTISAYKDNNPQNGVLDAAELSAGPAATHVTDAGTGAYSFALPAGNYIICETFLTSDWAQSLPGSPVCQGTAATAGYFVAAAAGQTYPNRDFGNYRNAVKCGAKFEDVNGNGVWDNSELVKDPEPAIAGWKIDLSGKDGLGNIVTKQAITGGEATNYCFKVPPGTYTVCEEPQNGWIQSFPNPGTAGSACHGSNGYAVTLTSGQTELNNDFGNFQNATICGSKFEDLNGNGIWEAVQKPVEPAHVGWSIYLNGTDGMGNTVGPIKHFTTDEGYCFSVQPGTYTVCEGVETNWVQTFPNPGTNGTACDVTGFTAPAGYAVTVFSGQAISAYDFGNYQQPSICGTKFYDTDSDGVLDHGETGIPDWTIHLFGKNNTGNNNIIMTTTTSADGGYCFLLEPGTYTVCEEAVSGWTQTAPIPGSDFTQCENHGFAGGGYTQTLQSGMTPNDYDFGNIKILQNAQICGSKFEDLNGNGVWDPKEPSIGGWAVILLDTSGNVVKKSVTVQDKGYCFDVPAGTYTICEAMQDGRAQSFPNPGTAGTDCPDADPTYGPHGYQISVAAGDSLTGYDFGNYQLASICGNKFHDENANGQWDLIFFFFGEPGIDDWTIHLTGTDGMNNPVDLTTTTGPWFIFSGFYCFNGLAPGTYTVCEVPQTDWSQSAPNPGTDNGDCAAAGDGNAGYSYTLISGDNVPGVDFGNFQNAQKCGTAFEDWNGNGVQDAGEPGIGLSIDLFGTDGSGNAVYQPSTTNGDGTYCFTVAPGAYTVCIGLPTDWTESFPNPGTDGGTCSNNGYGPYGYSVTLTSGQQEMGNDFGVFFNVEQCGYKFEDLNGNGVFDTATESGIPDWQIHLFGTDGLGNTQDKMETTDANGFYCLQVPPGSYSVCEELQADWFQSSPAPGTDGTACEDTGYAANGYAVTLTLAQNPDDLYFGNFQNAQICGHKYSDDNNNGSIDSGEPSLAGWQIGLNGTSGLGAQVSGSTTTTTDGYCFSVAPGTYKVCETAQDNWTQTYPNATSAAGGVFCGDPATYGYSLTVSSGQTVLTADFANHFVDPGGGGGGGGGCSVGPITIQDIRMDTITPQRVIC